MDYLSTDTEYMALKSKSFLVYNKKNKKQNQQQQHTIHQGL